MSLLPGWDVDRPQEAPNDFSDDHNEESTNQPLGYFAKLERARSLRHPRGVDPPPNLGVLPPSYSLRRSSAPLMDSASEAILANLHRKSLAGPVETSSDISSLKAAAEKCGGALKPHHATTDWSEELNALGGHRAVSENERKERKLSAEAWWSHMDAGALNQHPDVPEEKDGHGNPRKKDSFTPQFSVTGQKLQYHQEASESSNISPG